MRKSVWTILIVLLAVLLIGGGIFYFYGSYQLVGDTANGWFNPDTQECWLSPDHPPGEPMPVEELEGLMFASCCFNGEGDQVDCNNANNILGEGVLQEWITFGGGDPANGIFSIKHIITIANDIDSPVIDEAWISVADWNPTHSEIENAYESVQGQMNSVGPLNPDEGTFWETGFIDLTEIAGEPGFPITYELYMEITASAHQGQLESTQDISTTMIVEAEDIGFSVTIDWQRED